MKTLCQQFLLGTVLGLASANLAGCGGGGTPQTGERAVLPPTYAVREKEMVNGFREAMKRNRMPGNAASSRGRKLQAKSAQPR